MKKFFIIILAALSFGLSAQVTLVNVGSAPNMHDGDPLRTAFQKVNASLTYLEGLGVGGSGLIDTTGLPVLGQIPVFTEATKIGGYSNLRYVYNTMRIIAASGDTGLWITNGSTKHGILLNNSSTGYGINMTNSAAGIGLIIANNNVGYGTSITNSNVGIGHYINNTSTGIGYYTTNSAAGEAINIGNSGAGYGLRLDNSSTGIGVDINQSASGTAFQVRYNASGTFKITRDSVFLSRFSGDEDVWLTLSINGAIDTAHTVNAGFMLSLSPFLPITEYMADISNDELKWYYKDRKTGGIRNQYGLKGIHPVEQINALMGGVERSLRYINELHDKINTLESELRETQYELDELKRSYEFRLRSIEAKMVTQ